MKPPALTQHKQPKEMKNDFPSFLSPLLVKELRQGLRSRVFLILMIFIPLILAFPFLLACIVDRHNSAIMDEREVSNFFWFCSLGFFLIACPLRALSSIHQEKTTRSSDLLVLTSMSSFRITFQKWLSYTLQSLLLVCCLLPFLVLRYFLGGVEIISDVVFLFITFVLGSGLTAIGLWCSGLPALYRILWAIALLPLFVAVMAAGQDGIEFLFPLDWSSLVFLLLYISFIYWVSVCFLFMAARNFSPPSENLSEPLRKILLWGILISGVITLGLYHTILTENEILPGLLIACTLVYATVCFIEILIPVSFNHAILVKRIDQRKRLRTMTTLLFLPGWQSASLFALLCIFFSAIFILFTYLPFKITYVFIGLTSWATLVLPCIVLRPLIKKLGVHSLILFAVYMVLSIVFIAILEQVHGNSILAGLLPFRSIVVFLDQGSKPYWPSILFVASVFLLYVATTFSFWRQVLWMIRSKHKHTLEESHDSPARHKRN